METWAPIQGLDGYEVSDMGRVRSWWKSARNLRVKRAIPVALKGRRQGDYWRFRFSVSGVKTDRFAHHLVLEAFVGPRPSGAWSLHRNGDASDNRISNLYWGTPKQNADDRDTHGRTLHGALNPKAKLAQADVNEIRRAYSSGERNQVSLADEFGVSQAQISSIVLKKTWRAPARLELYMSSLGMA